MFLLKFCVVIMRQNIKYLNLLRNSWPLKGSSTKLLVYIPHNKMEQLSVKTSTSLELFVLCLFIIKSHFVLGGAVLLVIWLTVCLPLSYKVKVLILLSSLVSHLILSLLGLFVVLAWFITIHQEKTNFFPRLLNVSS